MQTIKLKIDENLHKRVVSEIHDELNGSFISAIHEVYVEHDIVTYILSHSGKAKNNKKNEDALVLFSHMIVVDRYTN